MKRLSNWIEIDHCATRVIEGGDPELVENRVAFIEKTPRVRIAPWTEENDILNDFHNWESGPKGDGQLCGKDQRSRDWCDKRLNEMGYEFD